MALLILAPKGAAPAYDLAAKAFRTMYEQVTGQRLAMATCDDGVSDLVVIGSDSVNDYLMSQILELRLDTLGIRYGTDEYCIRSYRDGQRNVLILAGGRGRSTLYAVYDYFERYANCHYFWDGDVIPHADSLPMCDIAVLETPRFEYRGTRYFAHRGLKRFQAEHWSLEDWKKELDWLVKKRLNFFMLRIGMDDVWQKAFPEDVPYPEGFQNMEASGFHDRSDFWTLKFRGQLRQQVMQYARDLDLSSSVDCGTMTHWYSRTPQAFLDAKNPSFVTQELPYYADGNTGNVMDFTKKDMMSYYMKLTDTMVSEYDKDSTLFHTIGLGERYMYADPRKNFAMKRFAYRRVAEEIRTKYPYSKLMLATWDFAGYWQSAEVARLMEELDPDRTVILDYTSEIVDPDNSFLNWGVVGKFPWIFGIFHAFESESEIRGPYDRIEARFSVAAKDPCCKGMIYWPELSHSDPLILEYLTQNSWKPLEKSVEEIIQTMCRNRYGVYAETMNRSWNTALPVITLMDWGSRTQRSPEEPDYEDYANLKYSHTDIWTRLTLFLTLKDSEDPVTRKFFAKRMKKYEAVKGVAADALLALPVDVTMDQEPQVCRDVIDLTRTMLGRYMNLIVMSALEHTADRAYLLELKHQYTCLMDLMISLLKLNPDFSMLATLEELKRTALVNPKFERTLKHNLCNSYCLQAALEPANFLYKKEIEPGFGYLMSPEKDKAELAKTREALLDEFWDKPLAEMQPEETKSLKELLPAAAEHIRNLEAMLFL